MLSRLFVRLYLALVILIFIMQFTIYPIVGQLIKSEVEKAVADLSKGGFYLMAKEFEGLDAKGVQARLDQLQEKFGYPLALGRLDEIELAKEYRQAVQRGEVVYSKHEGCHYLRLPMSNMVLITGPYVIDDVTVKARLLFMGLMIFVLTLPAGVWAVFMQKHLKRAEDVAEEFVSGNHSVRLKLPRFLPLQRLGSVFNHMAEGTQKLIQSQKELVNSVAHEIRTPLARVKFSLKMLESGGLESSEEKKEYIDEIHTDVEEINSLVDEMLTYARFERQREIEEVLFEHDMISWIQDLVDSEQTITSKKILLDHTRANRPLMNRFEPFYMARALRNLIRNAARYADRKIVVTISTQWNQCFIQVDDDGPGILESDYENIFKPFTRLDLSRNKAFGESGYGLGLAIAHQIVIWHKGDITVDRSPFDGTRFTISLPLS